MIPKEQKNELKIRISKTEDLDFDQETDFSNFADIKSKPICQLPTFETLPDNSVEKEYKSSFVDMPTVKKSLNNPRVSTPSKTFNFEQNISQSQKCVAKSQESSKSVSKDKTSIAKTSGIRSRENESTRFILKVDQSDKIESDKMFNIRRKFLNFENKPCFFFKVLGFGVQTPFMRFFRMNDTSSITSFKKDKPQCRVFNKNGSVYQAESSRKKLEIQSSKKQGENDFPEFRKVTFGKQNLDLSFFSNSQLFESLAKFHEEGRLRQDSPERDNLEESKFNSSDNVDNIKSLNSFFGSRSLPKPANTSVQYSEKTQIDQNFQKSVKNHQEWPKSFNKIGIVNQNIEFTCKNGPYLYSKQSLNNDKQNVVLVEESLSGFQKQRDSNQSTVITQKSDDCNLFMESDKDLNYASFKYLNKCKTKPELWDKRNEYTENDTEINKLDKKRLDSEISLI